MSDGRKQRMLIVDDEEGMRRTLRRIMKARGYEVMLAADGHEAIECATEFQPDVILMDIRMPGLNGVEAYRRLKSHCPSAAAIFMTACATSEQTQEAMTEGAIDVMTKPLDVNSLCQLVHQTLTSHPLLIVDDDAGFRNSLQRALTKLGFRVATAEGLEDALEGFRQQPQSVALLDMRLDGHTGLELLKKIRELNPEAIAVLMTGFTEMETEMHSGLASGACRTFVKPFDVEHLVAEIRSRV